MKLALWGSYGTMNFPKGFNIDTKDGLAIRLELADYLLTHITALEDMSKYIDSEDFAKAVKNSADNCLAVLYKNQVKYYTYADHLLGYWYVVDVDTSKLWLLDCYDGSEGIKYFEADSNNQLIEV